MPADITPEALAEIERRAEELLSPAPWRVEEDWTYELTAADGRVIAKFPYPTPQGGQDAHGTTLARNSLPLLCASLRAAWAERDRLREEGYQAAFEWAAERDRLKAEVERTRKHPPCRLCGAPYEGIPLALYCEDCHSKGLR